MKVKPIVTIALGVFVILVFFIMAVGLFIPREVLNSLSLNSTTNTQTVKEPNKTENTQAVPDSSQNQTNSSSTSSSSTSNSSTSSSSSSTSSNTSTSVTPTPTPTPAPSQPVAACGSGGTCTVANDVTPYSSQSDCRIAIKSGVSGQPSLGIYKIPSSFLSTHAAEKSISRYCGQTYSIDLKSAVGKHTNGSSLGGSTYDQWIKNFYFASL